MSAITQQIMKDLEQLPTPMQAETLDFVQFLKSKLERSKMNQPSDTPKNGKAMAAIFEKMAAGNALSDIKDPVKWQQEIRKDRPLPGRED